MLFVLRSFRTTQIVGGFLLVSALLLAALVGLGGMASGVSLAQMPLATSESLAQAAPGSTVLIEGRISDKTLRPQNAPDADMIVWTSRLRLPAETAKTEAHWLNEDMVKQPLMLDLGNTPAGIAHVAVTNDDYGLATLPTVINDADYIVNGLSVGNAIVVMGEVATADHTGPVPIHARQIIVGTRDDLVQQMQRMDWPYLIAAAALTLAGVLTLLLDRLLLKPANHAQTISDRSHGQSRASLH